MKILVCGGAGFVGSRLCPLLDKLYDLTILDTFWFWDDKQHYYKNINVPNATLIQEDIREESIKNIIKNQDCVINLACLSNDMSSDIEYNLTHEISYNGVMNIINNVVEYNIPKFIQTSTTSVYGVRYGDMVDEYDILEPITQYSKIKAEIDNVLRFYIDKRNSNFVILRPATLYGYSPRLRLDIMVNTMLDRVVKHNKLVIEGGEQFRPCLHIDDLCETYIKVMQSNRCSGKIYNVTNENYSVNEIVKIIQELVPSVELHYQHVIDARSYRTNSNRIISDLHIVFKNKLKEVIEQLYHDIKYGFYNRDKSINSVVIKNLLDKGCISY